MKGLGVLLRCKSRIMCCIEFLFWTKVLGIEGSESCFLEASVVEGEAESLDDFGDVFRIVMTMNQRKKKRTRKKMNHRS